MTDRPVINKHNIKYYYPAVQHYRVLARALNEHHGYVRVYCDFCDKTIPSEGACVGWSKNMEWPRSVRGSDRDINGIDMCLECFQKHIKEHDTDKLILSTTDTNITKHAVVAPALYHVINHGHLCYTTDPCMRCNQSIEKIGLNNNTKKYVCLRCTKFLTDVLLPL